MIKTLANGVSGMRAQQFKMDIIGNNIANVQTTSYKRSKANFSEVVRQALGDQGIPAADNPRPAEGNGVQVISIHRVFNQGDLMETKRPLDLAIDGNSFFKVISPDDKEYFTRDGSFLINNEGELVTAGGYVLETDFTLEEGVTSFAVDPKGVVRVKLTDGTEQGAGTIELHTFPAPVALRSEGNNLFTETEDSGEAVAGEAGEDGFGFIRQGFLERSNVDLTQEMVSMIEAQRAYSLNARTIQTADQMWSQANNLRK